MEWECVEKPAEQSRVVHALTKGCVMPRGKGYEDDEPKGGRPGPSDQGREGGMATRENAPEITTPDDAPEPPD
jgi:hypothetical protein